MGLCESCLADARYNGWTNYETWAVHLHLTNTESSQNYWREKANECKAEAPTCQQVEANIWKPEEAAGFLLADALKYEIEEGNPIAEATSLYSDLLAAAISEVDWLEIAKAFLGQDD
jgi:hypothetical protein